MINNITFGEYEFSLVSIFTLPLTRVRVLRNNECVLMMHLNVHIALLTIGEYN